MKRIQEFVNRSLKPMFLCFAKLMVEILGFVKIWWKSMLLFSVIAYAGYAGGEVFGKYFPNTVLVPFLVFIVFGLSIVYIRERSSSGKTISLKMEVLACTLASFGSLQLGSFIAQTTPDQHFLIGIFCFMGIGMALAAFSLYYELTRPRTYLEQMFQDIEESFKNKRPILTRVK
ncbi:MAG: hypothetical protein ACM3UU_03555 [Ignavibacteriales bacterium]